MKKHLTLAFLALLTSLICIHVQPVFSQTSEEIKSLEAEIKALKEGQTAIQKDLQEIKKLLQARPAPPARPEFKETVVNIDKSHFKGEKKAKLVLIEFSDYQ